MKFATIICEYSFFTLKISIIWGLFFPWLKIKKKITTYGENIQIIEEYGKKFRHPIRKEFYFLRNIKSFMKSRFKLAKFSWFFLIQYLILYSLTITVKYKSFTVNL